MSLDLKDKRVLVTGGEGFLGSHVVPLLAGAGAIVYVATHEHWDLTEQRHIRELYLASEPDMVVHLAAKVGGIGANNASPGHFYYSNLMMGAMLMHEALRWGTEKFLTLGTICSYPKHTPTPFEEKDLWNGYPEETNAPYGLAKKMLLVQSQAYRQQYGFNSVVLFPVNLYGPGDNFNLDTSHVIPAIIRKAIEAKEAGKNSIGLWGDGTPTREFLYVKDAARGIVSALQQYDSSEPVNLGTGQEIRMEALAAKILKACEYPGVIIWDTSRPNGQPKRCLSIEKAKEAFNFSASTTLNTGLVETIEWYLENRDLADR